jgi:ABC-type sugar transport system permease subunit
MYFPRNPECCIYSFDFILGAIMMDFHQRFQDCWRELPLCNGDDRRWHISSGRNCWKEVWSRQRSPAAAVEPRIGEWELYGFVIGPKGNPLSSFPFPMAISGVYNINQYYTITKNPLIHPESERVWKELSWIARWSTLSTFLSFIVSLLTGQLLHLQRSQRRPTSQS